MPLLEVDNLRTYYSTDSGIVKAADGITFHLDQGESLGIAGESGCGKTTIVMTLMRLIKDTDIVEGEVILDGQSILEMPIDEFRHLRGKKIALISQAAMGALNPVFSIGWQIMEAIRYDTKISKAEARGRTVKLLEQVKVDPSRMKAYPHELSGGMCQRAMIAMALSCDPKIVIADEMTTALDVVTQVQMLRLFNDLRKNLGLSVIAISHELPILGQICDKFMVMYAGKMMEIGDKKQMFGEPKHPYTKWLLGSLVDIKAPRRIPRGIPGKPPDLINPPSGCRFEPRCPIRESICKTDEPVPMEVQPNNWVACHMVK
jgi:peptide/nickel transport system ATP-binding protein